MRDTKTAEVKKLIGEGFKMKMDETGNILVKRYGKSNVLVQNTLQNANDETVIGADIAKLPNHALQVGKSGKVSEQKIAWHFKRSSSTAFAIYMTTLSLDHYHVNTCT